MYYYLWVFTYNEVAMAMKLYSYFEHVTTGPYSLFECTLLIQPILNNMRPVPNMYYFSGHIWNPHRVTNLRPR